MASQSEPAPTQRRFLAINFWIGSRDNGYLVGPALVSTSNYQRFHLWDEPGAAVLNADDYEVVKAYPLGLTYDEAAWQFARDFPLSVVGPHRSAGWVAADGAFYSAAGWVDVGWHAVVAA